VLIINWLNYVFNETRIIKQSQAPSKKCFLGGGSIIQKIGGGSNEKRRKNYNLSKIWPEIK